MKTGLMMLWLLLASQADGAVSCPDLTAAGLRRLIHEKRPLDLVFFATWCSGCKQHLETTADHDVEKVFIITFDERAAGEKVLGTFGFRGRCFFDAGASKSLQVKSLPYVYEWRG